MGAGNEKKTRPGDRVAIKSSTWNTLVDVAKWFKLVRTETGDYVPDSTVTGGSTVFLQNQGSEYSTSFHVARIDGPLFDIAANQNNAFRRPATVGSVPGSCADPFAIYQGPCASGAIQKGVYAGLTLAYVEFLEDSTGWCNPKPGEHRWLRTTKFEKEGQAKILAAVAAPPEMMYPSYVGLCLINIVGGEVNRCEEESGDSSGDSGSGPDSATDCGNVLPAFDSTPDGLDPEVVVFIGACFTDANGNGAQYIYYAKQRVVCDKGKARIQYYDLRYERRCCVPCTEDSGGGSFPDSGGPEPEFCNTYNVGGVNVDYMYGAVVSKFIVWSAADGSVVLTWTQLSPTQGIWVVFVYDEFGSVRCTYTGPDGWTGYGCADFPVDGGGSGLGDSGGTSGDALECAGSIRVCCGENESGGGSDGLCESIAFDYEGDAVVLNKDAMGLWSSGTDTGSWFLSGGIHDPEHKWKLYRSASGVKYDTMYEPFDTWDGTGCMTFFRQYGTGPNSVTLCCGDGASGGDSGTEEDCELLLQPFVTPGLNMDADSGAVSCHVTMTGSSPPPQFTSSACTGGSVIVKCIGSIVVLDVSSAFTSTSHEIYYPISGTDSPFMRTYQVPRNRFGGPDATLMNVVITE